VEIEPRAGGLSGVEADMIIKTASGDIKTSKRRTYGKVVAAYAATGAWTGTATLAAAVGMAEQLRRQFPSLSARDSGRLAGQIFIHKPSEGFLEAVTGVKMPRE